MNVDSARALVVMAHFRERKSWSRSATRALDVLEYFGRVRKPLRAKEVAETLNLPASSADQLLKTMVSSGYLNFDPIEKLYDPSPRLTNFASWQTSECFWNEATAEVLEDLRARTRAMISLMQRTDDFVRIIDTLLVEEEDYPRSVGTIFPLDTVAGQAFLAACGDDQMERIVERAMRHRHLPVNSSDQLVETVRTARANGFASGNRYDKRLWSVSLRLSLESPTHTRVVVLSISGTKERLRGSEDAMIGAIQECARELERCRLSRRAPGKDPA